ncbi:hypothetical protein BDN71DRAFT_1404655, partial [Pleurotus eryngii]
TNEIITLFDLEILWNEYSIDNHIVPFTADFPRADIHKLLAPDLLHQIIKGSFKDHLVTWVEEYLHQKHTSKEASCIMDEIGHQ